MGILSGGGKPVGKVVSPRDGLKGWEVLALAKQRKQTNPTNPVVQFNGCAFNPKGRQWEDVTLYIEHITTQGLSRYVITRDGVDRMFEEDPGACEITKCNNVKPAAQVPAKRQPPDDEQPETPEEWCSILLAKLKAQGTVSAETVQGQEGLQVTCNVLGCSVKVFIPKHAAYVSFWLDGAEQTITGAPTPGDVASKVQAACGSAAPEQGRSKLKHLSRAEIELVSACNKASLAFHRALAALYTPPKTEQKQLAYAEASTRMRELQERCEEEIFMRLSLSDNVDGLKELKAVLSPDTHLRSFVAFHLRNIESV